MYVLGCVSFEFIILCFLSLGFIYNITVNKLQGRRCWNSLGEIDNPYKTSGTGRYSALVIKYCKVAYLLVLICVYFGYFLTTRVKLSMYVIAVDCGSA